jgi:hypothetical protein
VPTSRTIEPHSLYPARTPDATPKRCWAPAIAAPYEVKVNGCRRRPLWVLKNFRQDMLVHRPSQKWVTPDRQIPVVFFDHRRHEKFRAITEPTALSWKR